MLKKKKKKKLHQLSLKKSSNSAKTNARDRNAATKTNINMISNIKYYIAIKSIC